MLTDWIKRLLPGASKDTSRQELERKSLEELLLTEDAYWQKAKKRALRGQRVLIATSMGCYEHARVVESLLAAALTVRGARVEFLLCDEFLPCCQMTKIFNVAPEALTTQDHTPRCASCRAAGESTMGRLGLKINWFSQLAEPHLAEAVEKQASRMTAEEMANYTLQGVAIGEHAMAGALRYFARGDLSEEPQGLAILRRYFRSAVLTAHAVERLLSQQDYDVAVFHHGIYVPQGIVGEVCRRRGVRVVNWNPSYRKQTFVFSHDDSYHHTMISEPATEWKETFWDPDRERTIIEYLKSRWYGTQDWIWFHEKPVEDLEAIQAELGVDLEKPCIGMLTSVMWDAQLHYKSNAFPNMLEWAVRTVEYFRKRADLQLLIRIHPAEVTGLIPSRQKMEDEIRRRIADMPPNVVIIPPESRLSTYALMQKCNTVIIYNTKTGIEITSMGIPVIVAGEAWIRGKGFAIDVSSPEEYFAALDRLPLAKGLPAEQLLMARKYAYHFFFRRMIELPFVVSQKKNHFGIELGSLMQLKPGVDLGLDVICDGVLSGRPFVAEPIGRG
jgi:hypothetical protein